MRQWVRHVLIGMSLLPSTQLLAQHKPLFTPDYYQSRFLEAGNVPYFGGAVLSHAKVYAVLWGANVDAEIQSQIGPFYQALVNSTYMDWLQEYNTHGKAADGRDGTLQDIGRGSFGGVVTITPLNTATTLSQAAVEQELSSQIEQGHLPAPDANTLYMIHFPPTVTLSISWGDSCVRWCADHERFSSPKFGNIYYALMPDLGSCPSACGGGSGAFAATTICASHELAEAITDAACPISGAPIAFPAAWIRADGNEIGDLCAWQGASLKGPASTFSVQAEWDNSASACKAGTFTSP